ncbi:MAG TPA: PQQ-dependent sugar dehydrogenase [Nitrososphaeraceae archaeon]|jgi:aldose sugar dehydrogenase
MINQIKSFRRKRTIAIVLIATFAVMIPILYLIHNSSIALAAPSITKDPNLKVETLVTGLSSPTSMAFIDNKNILVLEKGGQVRLVLNGILQGRPVLQVPVDTENERGLLGIAIMNGTKSGNAANNNKFVFLYYTESKDGQLRNRVYRYNWDEQNQNLVNPTLILDLPAFPGPNHDGGKLVIGPDHYLYTVIGDLNHRGKLQNIKDGPDPDDTSVIFRVNPNDGSAAKDNPFISNNVTTAMHKYYAYGVRNSFGITFDPITGNLWQTENGPDVYDEINVVKPGFNSGWIQVMGPLSRNPGISTDQLVNYPSSHYANPRSHTGFVNPAFSWYTPIAVTDIEFMKSSMLGEKYRNNVFVGDDSNGNLYYFEVNSTRTGFKFNPITQPGLADLVADNDKEVSEVTFGTGFGGITDLKTGPADGFLYVLSINDGAIYKVVPASSSLTQ